MTTTVTTTRTGSHRALAAVGVLLGSLLVSLPVRPPAALADPPADCIRHLRFTVTTGTDGIRDDADESIVVGGQLVFFLDADGDGELDADGGSQNHRGHTGDRGNTTFVWDTELRPCVRSDALLDGFEFRHSNFPIFDTHQPDQWDLAALEVSNPDRLEVIRRPLPVTQPFRYFADSGTPLHHFEANSSEGDVSTFTARPIDLNVDTDRDGLTDLDELRGTVSFTPLGPSVDRFLPDRAADPCRKTIAVELDWLQDTAGGSDKPSDGVVTEAERMFDAAPFPRGLGEVVRCPYYAAAPRPGIQLLVDMSNGITLSPAERRSPLWTPNPAETPLFDRYRDGSVLQKGLTPGRENRFFYSLWGYDLNQFHSWGRCCRGPRRSQFAVTVGHLGSRRTVRAQSVAFVHELGHALGLSHGGEQPEPTYTPNYLSVMNLRYSRVGLVDFARWREILHGLMQSPSGVNFAADSGDMLAALEQASTLDYSRSVLPGLERTVAAPYWNLREDQPLATSGAAIAWADPQGLLRAADPATGVDWDWSNGGLPDAGPTPVHVNVMGDTEPCLRTGDNQRLDASPVPDDIPSGNRIIAGPNGRCQTPVAGDDDDLIRKHTTDPNETPVSSLGVDYPFQRQYTTGVTGYDDWHNVQFHIGVNPDAHLSSTDVDAVEPSQADVDTATSALIGALLEAAGVPTGTTIDATALSATAYTVSGVPGWLNSATVRTLMLPAGRYTIAHAGSPPIPFTVDPIGLVDYDPQLTSLSGRGTHLLTVLGQRFTVDATQLSISAVGLSPATGWLVARTVQEVRLLPGRYSLVSAGATPVPVTLNPDGTLDYDPALTTVSGRGSSALTMVGRRFTVDATQLSVPAVALSPATGWLNARSTQEVRLMPGRYNLVTAGATPTPVTLNPDGTLDHDPTLTTVSGRGSTTLTATGYTLTVDATRTTCPAFGLAPATGWYATRPTAATLRLLPGAYTFISCPTGHTFPVTVTPAGRFDHDPTQPNVTGRGTTTLTVG